MPTRSPDPHHPSGKGATPLASPPPTVLVALRRVLAPLVRALIHFGIPWPMLSGLMKGVYVEVAERDFALPDKPMTDSRITLLTGVHRKDVSQLRGKAPSAESVASSSPSLGAQVLGRWLGHDGYRDADGRPRPLPRAGSAEGEAAFETLVTGVSKDIRPRALLDELLYAGLVEERSDGLLHLVVSAHLPRGDVDKLAYYFGRNLADHVAAAGHNLAGGAPPFLERAMFHDGLTPASVAALRIEAERAGMDMLVRLNRFAMELADRDEGRADAHHRFTAGLYAYDAPDGIPGAPPGARHAPEGGSGEGGEDGAAP
ncbi:hypothetical protein J2847_003899 [Azospirillum agricola]|uniref:DUF6502 family protein n=1 Tax=Azospirillum agricola TaxID=1720247 RepID=UPI001AEA43F2|nr:DUF6502 family protein [Azospirillum agricola]MBP2230594.1 hypothetical protein [Azospirillum agricola]